MAEIELFEGREPYILTVNEPSTIVCHGKCVMLQILCNTSETITITGDSLTVELDKHGIGIGADAEWGLSYGRYQFPNYDPKFVIDINEIHCHSKTPGCGIGSYAVRSVTSAEFTDNCLIRDTPVDMEIYNEPLSGSTKHNALPKYMTKAEKEAMNSNKNAMFQNKLLINLSQRNIADLVTKCLQKFEEDNLFDLIERLDKVYNRIEKTQFANCIQRVFGSVMDAFTQHDSVYDQCQIILHSVGYLTLYHEIRLFGKIAYYPLTLRYVQVAEDSMSDFMFEKTKESNMSSFEELHLSDELIQYYNHPTDKDYTKECCRSLWGMSFYQDWNDRFNSLIEINSITSKEFTKFQCTTLKNVFSFSIKKFIFVDTDKIARIEVYSAENSSFIEFGSCDEEYAVSSSHKVYPTYTKVAKLLCDLYRFL